MFVFVLRFCFYELTSFRSNEIKISNQKFGIANFISSFIFVPLLKLILSLEPISYVD